MDLSNYRIQNILPLIIDYLPQYELVMMSRASKGMHALCKLAQDRAANHPDAEQMREKRVAHYFHNFVAHGTCQMQGHVICLSRDAGPALRTALYFNRILTGACHGYTTTQNAACLKIALRAEIKAHQCFIHGADTRKCPTVIALMERCTKKVNGKCECIILSRLYH